ncbi:uncharacterized protein LOC121930381 isoform X2 [Sceloporus undulatus]|uniref:uncharacterized protein LOC121930381 isoform X2 n=1 Tax=Sceloporus undulatus TaxID=8520 RepID=UPI001C4D2536|nr:uncharacterized protein LOC121930381 isoform X2 [Sceloporus undulatus]
MESNCNQKKYPRETKPQPAYRTNVELRPRLQPIHEQMEELSLSTVYFLLAALMQCLSLTCLCVAVSMLKWVLVIQPDNLYPRVSISNNFGVPFEMDVNKLANTSTPFVGKFYFFSEAEEDVMPVMVTICIVCFIVGLLAFLLDFVEIKCLGQHQMSISVFLHILSGIFIITLMVLCCWCFLKIKRRVGEGAWKRFQLKVSLGESFYVTLMCLGLIILSIILSLRSMKTKSEITTMQRAASPKK